MGQCFIHFIEGRLRAMRVPFLDWSTATLISIFNKIISPLLFLLSSNDKTFEYFHGEGKGGNRIERCVKIAPRKIKWSLIILTNILEYIIIIRDEEKKRNSSFDKSEHDFWIRWHDAIRIRRRKTTFLAGSRHRKFRYPFGRNITRIAIPITLIIFYDTIIIGKAIGAFRSGRPRSSFDRENKFLVSGESGAFKREEEDARLCCKRVETKRESR